MTGVTLVGFAVSVAVGTVGRGEVLAVVRWGGKGSSGN